MTSADAGEAPVSLHRVYMLLGDPALRLRAATAQPDHEIDPPPGDGSTAPGGLPRVGEDSPASGSGCEIAPVGKCRGPFGLGLLVIGVVLAIRRRRA
jgi:hypothetical protein